MIDLPGMRVKDPVWKGYQEDLPATGPHGEACMCLRSVAAVCTRWVHHQRCRHRSGNATGAIGTRRLRPRRAAIGGGRMPLDGFVASPQEH